MGRKEEDKVAEEEEWKEKIRESGRRGGEKGRKGYREERRGGRGNCPHSGSHYQPFTPFLLPLTPVRSCLPVRGGLMGGVGTS